MPSDNTSLALKASVPVSSNGKRPGHLIGFLYMFLLMPKGTLLYTREHLNRV